MSPVSVFQLILGLLTVAVALALIARRLRIPPSAVYVVGGMALAVLPGVPQLVIDPGLMLPLFLPPLLQSSAFFTVWRDFRDNLRPILLLAIGCVAFTTALVGYVMKLAVPRTALGGVFRPRRHNLAARRGFRLRRVGAASHPTPAAGGAGGREPGERRVGAGALPLRRRRRAHRQFLGGERGRGVRLCRRRRARHRAAVRARHRLPAAVPARRASGGRGEFSGRLGELHGGRGGGRVGRAFDGCLRPDDGLAAARGVQFANPAASPG